MIIIATRTGVHGCHKHEIAGIVHSTLYTADGDMAVFQWLAQDLQSLALEFRQLVGKQNSIMRQGNLAGLRIGSATYEGRLADGMVRTAERPCCNERTMAHAIGANWRHLQFACNAMYLCGFQTLLQGKWRQDAG